MKTITVNKFLIVTLTILFSFSAVSAAEWVKVIEMGESGVAAEFPVTVPDKKLDLGEAVIARDTSGSAVVRVR